MLWDPLRFLESCPSSDGACAVVLTDERRRSGRRRGAAAGVDPRIRGALGAVQLSRAAIPLRPQAGVDCATDVYGQAGITVPREEIDCAELYVPFCWYEPMWLEGHDIAEPRRGLEDGRERRHRARRFVPREHVRRRAVVEPDRRVGAAALRRGRAAGARPGRRAPGRRRARRARPGLRRRGAVLQHVDRRRPPQRLRPRRKAIYEEPKANRVRIKRGSPRHLGGVAALVSSGMWSPCRWTIFQPSASRR